MQDLMILQQLAEHEAGWCRDRAQQMIAVSEQFDGGGLDSSEFADIIMRILDQPGLDSVERDLDTKQALVTAALSLAGHI
jgi:acyl carrier protein